MDAGGYMEGVDSNANRVFPEKWQPPSNPYNHPAITRRWDDSRPPPVGSSNWWKKPMIAFCPDCGNTAQTVIKRKVTNCTRKWMCTLWWIFPFNLIICFTKRPAQHFCSNCNSYLGSSSEGQCLFAD